MTDRQVRVTFAPGGRVVHVPEGEKVMEAAAQAGLTLQTPCGGGGVCGKCRIQVTSGACPATEAERKLLTAEQLQAGWRLACQTAICGEMAVTVPHTSLFADGQQIVTAARPATEVAPAVRKVFVRLPAPRLSDGAADLARLEQQLGPLEADLPTLAALPHLLREGGFSGTAVVADGRLIDFEPGDTTQQCLGAAVDLGTTTLAAVLLDLRSGGELAVASAVNPQTRFGDDVLSRIKHAASPGGLEQLRQTAAAAVDELIDRLCAQAAVARGSIYEVVLAGNTTMQHLLCGVDVAALGEIPFVPPVTAGVMLRASELGLAIHPRGAAYVFPCIGGFVGGDTVAGILSTQLAELPGPVLLVDIGTNGEIVLACDGAIEAASTAAGPAFEGARISCGMRATDGAVERVVFEGDVHCGVIGDRPPVGLCGSGLIDLAAGLLEAGIVTPQGRLLPREELPAELPAALAERVERDTGGQVRFRIGPKSTAQPPIALTQADVRQLQLATAAIRAGVSILLRRAGVASTDLKAVLVAGGFGSFIRRSHAQRIGLLPEGLDHRRIRYVGNTSLAGAKWALLSTRLRKQAEDLARRTRHVELSTDGGFQETFVESMIFPASA
ncbi:MAG: ASKHA domain-containing protein [Phycisphaerae bacterium]|nr:ASKHA domain-containing protein [Phycisphaerae bacterium]